MKELDKKKGFYVKANENIHVKFKVKCVENGEKMTDVIEKLMVEYSKGTIKL
jgi:hypothetical protein